MIRTIAVSGYRSLRELVLPLGGLTIVTGANGSGKSSLYRSLRLLSEVAQGRAIASLAGEGGLESTLWAGPETLSRAMRAGEQRIEGGPRRGPVALKLGFAADDYGYAIDMGLPIASSSRFDRDPEIKVEAMWTGAVLGRSNLFAERRGPLVRVRSGETGGWREAHGALSRFDSMMTHSADTADGWELLTLRDRMRDWRFYDNLRTDRDAPARRPQVGTFTPVLANDGADIGAALVTILEIGDGALLESAIADAFDGASVSVNDRFEIEMQQHGLLRRLGAAELSDGTLRYILLCAALLSPRPPELMVLNEPEASLHPDLLEPLARLLAKAAERCQIIVVSHAERLVKALGRTEGCMRIELRKSLGETTAPGIEAPDWNWPRR